MEKFASNRDATARGRPGDRPAQHAIARQAFAADIDAARAQLPSA